MRDPEIGFHGAAAAVTGSKHLIRAERRRVLLDAGLFQGLRELRRLNWSDPPFDPGEIDEVVVSHTHIDHIGYLPRLVRLGLQAPVHLTEPAYDLARLMLLDAAKIQEEEAAYANRKGFSKHSPALPLFTERDAKAALKLRRRTPYGEWIELAPRQAFRARFHGAGHILGSSFVELEIGRGPRPLRVVFSGDVGRYDMPLHPDPMPLPPCDVLICETTYGDRTHTRRPLAEQLLEPLQRVIERRGICLIPAFAVGRTQQITLVLRQLMNRRLLPDVPIHIDSPMATRATRIYSRFLEAEHIDPEVFEDGRVRLFPRHVTLHRTTADSKALNRLDGPRIIVSASGMLTGGRVLHHLKRLAPDRDNLILLVGYQAAGTRGRDLVEGADRVKVHGEFVRVACEVVQLHGLSGHADRDELLRWIATAPRPPRLAYLVHGEEGPRAAFARALAERWPMRIVEPELGQRFRLADGEPVDGARRTR